jgi:23S rRNA pseudouridine955/2504/2580 synthase
MKKSYIVDSTCNDMRLDRWLRLKIGKIPQGLVEKYLRTGKIKLDNAELQEALIEITKKKISVDNPRYSTYKKLIK